MSRLIKPITSDQDLIELAERLNVHLDDIVESSEITKQLPKKGTYLILLRPPGMVVGHRTCVHDGEYFYSMGEAAPTKYGIGRYNPKQIQGTYGDYCGIWCMLWFPKAEKSFKTGKLSLTSSELKGSGSVIHLHPASYEKALKARKAGRCVRLDIIRHEVKKGYTKAQRGSVWSKIWGVIKSAYKFAKDSCVLSKLADAAVAPASEYTGNPGAVMAVREGLNSLTGIGVYDSDSDVDKEGGRLTMDDVKKGAKRALSYAKRKGILTDVVDSGEKYLQSKATKPEHEHLIKSLRGEVRRRYGVGVTKPKGKKFTKGSQEA
ncbi:unnamed protein product [Phytophthora fragariaefolia]|uniref:Unnamed protein product n=1 Tax=Phytophthora fragariaefolia TaxID=1490495 RepID=A0A9W7CYE7_9STRA|nr:unnamed protein product [Phytophthora fragariaefolia]